MKPNKVGLYMVRCEEGDKQWEHVAVTADDDGNLQVHDRHIGVYPLDAYHDGLTSIEWKFII